jgi:Winged helix-turn helix
VLAAAEGLSSSQIASDLGISVATVRTWRDRFAADRLDGLVDEPRPGRPRTITDHKVDQVIVKTLESTPKDATHWSTRSMAREVGLTQDGGAGHLAGVRAYLNPTERAVVLAVDEKSQIQALDRTRPILPMLPGTPERATHDYKRHGTSSLYAPLDLATGKVIGQARFPPRAIEFKKFLITIDEQVPSISTCTSCSTTPPRIRPRRSSAGCSPTPASRFTSPPPAARGSTSWSGGLPSCPPSSSSAPRTAPSARSPLTFARGSRPGTRTHNRSCGPRPPIRSSNRSPGPCNRITPTAH